MTHRSIALAALAFAALAAPAQEPKDKSKPGFYDTPQACFDAFVTAFVKKDAKTWAAALTPEARDDVAGELAAVLVSGRAKAKAETGPEAKERREKFRPLLAVMDKHGLTEKATKGVTWDSEANEKQRAAARKAALKPVKDSEAFLAEAWATLDKLGLPAADTYTSGSLKDVKADGERASGTATVTSQGRQLDETVTFVKVGGGWRLSPPAGSLPWRARE